MWSIVYTISLSVATLSAETIVENSWSASSISCTNQNETCHVRCLGDAVCADRAIYCPQFGACVVSCEGVDACLNSTIHRYHYVNVFLLECTGDGACDAIHSHYILDVEAEYNGRNWTLVDVSSSGTGLARCEGDCDSDSDCNDGLICYQRIYASDAVPGCAGVATTVWDYCIPNGSLALHSCPDDGDCSVLCNSAAICYSATIVCPAGFSCNVLCDANGGLYSCERATIDCAQSTQCNIACEGEKSCGYAQISWPTMSDATYGIECTGDYSCREVSSIAAYDDDLPFSVSFNDGTNVLQGATIICPKNAECNLACSNTSSCEGATIECPLRALSGVSTAFCSIRCTGDTACGSLNFVNQEAAAIRIEECRNNWACEQTNITAYPWNEPYELWCQGTGACSSAVIRCPLYSDCSIICDGSKSCSTATIYKPDTKYAFNLTCIDSDSTSCQNQTLHTQIAEYFIDVAAEYTTPGPTLIVCPENDRNCTVICDEANICTQSTIVCPLEADCHVRCNGEWSCNSTIFQCEHCSIECNGTNACVGNIVYQSSDAFAPNITCVGDGACVDMTFGNLVKPDTLVGGTTNVTCVEGQPCTVLCNADSICAQSRIQCPSDFACSIECGEHSACQLAMMNCSSSSECNINCAGTQSCDSADILWPLDGQPYDIVCSGIQSCRALDNIGAYDDEQAYRFVAPAANAVAAATITCPANAMCDIECVAEFACFGAHFNCPVDDGSGSHYCNISCVGQEACADSTYSGSVHINECRGVGACTTATGMHIGAYPDTEPWGIWCEGDRACSGAHIVCPEYADCIVHCVGDDACANASIYTPVRLYTYTLDCSSQFDACSGLQEIARTLPPTSEPTTEPTSSTLDPTSDPTSDPTYFPTTSDPTYFPTASPSLSPTSSPTLPPTNAPTTSPTSAPTDTCHDGKYKGTMVAGDSLWANESFVSSNCLYRLRMDPNGNLRMYALINGWYIGWQSETRLYNFTGMAVPKFYIDTQRLHIDEYENFGTAREAIIPLWSSATDSADTQTSTLSDSVVLTLTNRACLNLSDASGRNVFWQKCSRFTAPPQVTVMTTRLPFSFNLSNGSNSSRPIGIDDTDNQVRRKYAFIAAAFILLTLAFISIMCWLVAKQKLCVISSQHWLDSTVNAAEYKKQHSKSKAKRHHDKNTLQFAVSWDDQNADDDEHDVLQTEPHETESEESISEKVNAWYEEKDEVARAAFANRQKTKDITQAVHIELNANNEIDEISVDEPAQHTLEKERDALKMLDRKQTLKGMTPVRFGHDASKQTERNEKLNKIDKKESAPIKFIDQIASNGKNSGESRRSSQSQSNSESYTGLLQDDADDNDEDVQSRTHLFGESDDEDTKERASEALQAADTTEKTGDDADKAQPLAFINNLFGDSDEEFVNPLLELQKLIKENIM